MTPGDIGFIILLIVIAGLAFEFIGEFIWAVLILLLILACVSFENDPDYYKSCTDGGQSYVHCFYDRVIKP